MADYKLKLKALLHDPVDKMLNLKNHEEIAEKIFHFLFTETPHISEAKLADSIASALSRIIVAPKLEKKENEDVQKNFQEQSSVNLEEAYFIDIFSEKIHDIEVPQNHKDVEDLFKKLESLSFTNQDEKAKIIFLFLWRFLPDIFPWINKHPADSRAPNHSIYDHLVQASAVVSSIENNKIPAFLLFTISPVQEFISKARKTSDLWAGSYMLSYLIYKCIEVVMEKLGPDNVIFPNLLGQPLVDRWLYEKFKNTSIANLNDHNFQKWLQEWQKFESKRNEQLEGKLTIANFPNRFLAIIPYDNSLAKEVENKFKNNLEELAGKVSEKLIETLKNSGNSYSEQDLQNINQNFKDQIKSHLLNYFQCYWVVLPWVSKIKINYPPNDALEDYKELISDQNELYRTVQTIVNHPYYKPANVGSAYSLLLELTEKLLGARKSIRNVLGENYYESRGEKCHLCGEFEVLDFDWEKLIKDNTGLLKKGEKLCGVCMTKRLFPEIIKDKLGLQTAIKFPSTSEMASIGEKRTLKTKDKQDFEKIFNTFKSNLKNNYQFELPETISVPALKNDPLYKIDGQYLMEETYRPEYFEREYGIKLKEDDFKEIIEFLKEKNISPSKYYAILQMDGDNMGKWLKGEFNPKIKDTIHKKVVDALISYSEEKDKKELEELLCYKHPTSPSIHQAFSRKLSQFALEKVRKIVEYHHYGKLIYAGGDDILAFLPIEEVLDCAYDLQEEFKKILSPKASMSAGILIVHHKYPLYLALNEVRNAEKMAKLTFGKDAFCIRIISHSGEIRDSGGKWALISFLNDLICKFKNKHIPSGFPNEFAEVYEKEGIEDTEILRTELKRIYLRKQVKDKEYINEILKNFDSYEFDLKYFVNLLLISRFIARESKV